MKARVGYVSNSSSSSFVVLKDALTGKQQDMILNYQGRVEFFLEEESTESALSENKLKDRFEYYKSDPWRIVEFDDFIFGETSMDNFDMIDYLDYIKIDKEYICDDEGWIDEPTSEQINFIRKMKKKLRKQKIDKLNNLEK